MNDFVDISKNDFMIWIIFILLWLYVILLQCIIQHVLLYFELFKLSKL